MTKHRHYTLIYSTSFLIITGLLLLVTNSVYAEPGRDEKIHLGAILPLTGDMASYGNTIRDGIELAISDLQEQGFQASIHYEDVPTPDTAAINAINRLINEKKIQGLAGNFMNLAIPMIAPILTRSGIVAFHTAAADDLILEAGDRIFSTNAKIRDEAARIAEYVYDEIGARSACVMYVGTFFGENYYKHFVERFEARGGRVSYSELTALGESDLRTVLARVKSSSCEVFFAAYFGTNLGLVLKQARMIGISKPIMSVYEAEDPSVLEVGGSAAEGLRFFVPEAFFDTLKIQSFKQRFSERFGYTARILASNAYDATTILVHALAACAGESECAANRIYNIRNYEGMSGTFSVDSDGAARKEFVLKIVRNAQFERVVAEK